MSKVIAFLETMGASPMLSSTQYAAAVAALDVDAAQRDALLARDHAVLNTLLGGRATQMMMALFPVEQPHKGDEKQDEDEKQDDEPSESIRRH